VSSDHDEYERTYCGLHWERGGAKVKHFSAIGGAKATTVKITLEVTDAYTLSSIMSDLQRAQQPPPKKAPKAPKPAEPRLALPAPLRRLTYDGGSL